MDFSYAKNPAREKLRFQVCMVFSILYALLSMFLLWSLIEVSQVDFYQFHERINASADEGRALAISHLSSIGGMSITAIAGLWVLLLSAETRIVVATRYAWWLFWSTNIFLATTFMIYMTTAENLASLLWHHGDINLSDGVLDKLIFGYKSYFILGIINMACFSILCLKKYKDVK